MQKNHQTPFTQTVILGSFLCRTNSDLVKTPNRDMKKLGGGRKGGQITQQQLGKIVSDPEYCQ